MRYHIGNHRNDCLLDKLHESAFMGVVYFDMEEMLLYWSMDQYNNVQKCVESKERCHVARWQERTNITNNKIFCRPWLRH